MSGMDGWADWQKTYQHGIFVICPPDEVRILINPLRQKYDPVSQSYIGTHITLTQPLLRPAEAADWDQLAAIVSSFEAFTIEYGPLSIWRSVPVVYHEINPVKNILDVRLALHQHPGLFKLSLPHTDDFIPHMTILEGSVTLERALEIMADLNAQGTSGSFQCTEIAFIKPDPEFHFEVLRTLPFHL